MHVVQKEKGKAMTPFHYLVPRVDLLEKIDRLLKGRGWLHLSSTTSFTTTPFPLWASLNSPFCFPTLLRHASMDAQPTNNLGFGIPPPPQPFFTNFAAIFPTCMVVRSLDDDDLGVEYMMCPWDTFRLVYNDYARRVACSPQHLLICRQGGEVVPPLLTAGEIGLMEGETLIVLGPVSSNSIIRTSIVFFFIKLSWDLIILLLICLFEVYSLKYIIFCHYFMG